MKWRPGIQIFLLSYLLWCVMLGHTQCVQITTVMHTVMHTGIYLTETLFLENKTGPKKPWQVKIKFHK